MRKAQLYRKGEGGSVHCFLCGHHCSIKEGDRGRCGVRENREGVLYSLVYGRVVAKHIDPIEKKPIFHLLPGSLSFSLATVGCNFSCKHCQNSSISQTSQFPDGNIPGSYISPEEIVEQALATGCQSISYTYVEPTIFFEYALDCMALARDAGLKNIFVSNGFMSREAAELLIPLLDAVNIDLKSFNNDFYVSICGARLRPVLDSIRLMHREGVLVEVTTLIIPGLNDSDSELKETAEFLVSIDPSIPWHVSGFYPTWKMTDRPPTSVAALARAREIGLAAGLHYVYEGNRPGRGGENTSCPSCGVAVILRNGFAVLKNRLHDGKCPSCGESIPGIWK